MGGVWVAQAAGPANDAAGSSAGPAKPGHPCHAPRCPLPTHPNRTAMWRGTRSGGTPSDGTPAYVAGARAAGVPARGARSTARQECIAGGRQRPAPPRATPQPRDGDAHACSVPAARIAGARGPAGVAACRKLWD